MGEKFYAISQLNLTISPLKSLKKSESVEKNGITNEGSGKNQSA